MKVGKTTNLEQRLRSLDNTSVPRPFRCGFAVEVDDETKLSVYDIKYLPITEQTRRANFLKLMHSV